LVIHVLYINRFNFDINYIIKSTFLITKIELNNYSKKNHINKINIMQTLYLWSTESRITEFKYGIFRNHRFERVLDSQTYFSYPCLYDKLYDVKITPNYKLPYNEIDKIISICKDKRTFERIKNIYNYDFPYLSNLLNFCLSNDGGYELLNIDAYKQFNDFVKNELHKFGIQIVKEYTDDEIQFINENNKKKYEKSYQELINKFDQEYISEIKPFDYQQYILDNKLHNFIIDKKGLLLWTCGLGKSYMSLFIAKKINAQTILICVPTKYLANQFANSVKNVYNINPIIKYSEGDSIEDVKNLLTSNKPYKIVISTYQSSKKILNINYKFDLKIGDEAHHLVTSKKEKNKDSFDKFHDIRSKYELYMTATPKKLNIIDSETTYDMDNEKQFGKVIDEKSIKWAIDNKKITDYDILNVNCDPSKLRKIINNINLKTICRGIESTKKRYELFFSAFIALKTIVETDKTHLLIYLNKQENASIVKQIIDKLLEEKVFEFEDDFYNQVLTSTSKNEYGDKLNIFNKNKPDCEISKFTNSKYGIVSCVYIFGEGVDLPKLNGVVIGEKMLTEIRIVQSCLRGNRLENGNPSKRSTIIIPNIVDESYTKLKHVLKLMASSDSSIDQKLEVVNLENISKSIKHVESEVEIKLVYDKEELNYLKLELNDKGYFGIYDVKKEYEYYKNIYSKYKFTSVNEFLNSNVFRKSDDRLYYEYHYGKIFKWRDFLSIDTSGWLQTKEEWVDFCKRNKIITTEEYYDKQKTNEKLPFEPELLYDNFNGVAKELYSKKKFKYIKKNS
tara:strand:- start:26899 stop:29268 length:2370 start_codon:yes stop_codon:yes gene_type:complete